MLDRRSAAALPGCVRQPVFWLVVLEALAAVLAGWAFWHGLVLLGIALLLVPVQVVVLLALIRSDSSLLFYFAALLPFTMLGLAPHAYMHLVMYGLVITLLAFLQVTRSVWTGGGETCSRAATSKWYRVPLVLLAVCIAVSYVNARMRGWNSSYLPYYSLLATQVFVLTWLAAEIPRNLNDVRTVIYIMAAGYAVASLVFPFLIPRAIGDLGKTIDFQGTVINLNTVGAHAAVFGMVAAGAAMDTRRGSVRVALLAVVLLLVAVLVVTRARAAWLGFAVAFMYMFARTRSVWLLLPLTLGSVALLSMDVFRGALVSRVGETSAGDPSLWGRYLLWVYALRVLAGNWLLGVGMENFRHVKHLYGYPAPMATGRVYNTHNLFLEFLVDLGVVGLGALVYLMGRSFLQLDRQIRRERTDGKWLAAGLNAGLIAFGVEGLLDCVIWSHGAFMLLGLLIGLTLATARTRQQMDPSHAAHLPELRSAC